LKTRSNFAFTLREAAIIRLYGTSIIFFYADGTRSTSEGGRRIDTASAGAYARWEALAPGRPAGHDTIHGAEGKIGALLDVGQITIVFAGIGIKSYTGLNTICTRGMVNCRRRSDENTLSLTDRRNGVRLAAGS